MKIIDEGEMQKIPQKTITTKNKNKTKQNETKQRKTEKHKWNRSYSKKVRAK